MNEDILWLQTIDFLHQLVACAFARACGHAAAGNSHEASQAHAEWEALTHRLAQEVTGKYSPKPNHQPPTQ